MPTLQELAQQALRFRDERNWRQFHTPKDMVLSLGLEVAELAEHLQWKNDQEFLEHLGSNKEAVSDELCDILYWVLLMANDWQIDLSASFAKKIAKNAQKYPLAEAYGSKEKR